MHNVGKLTQTASKFHSVSMFMVFKIQKKISLRNQSTGLNLNIDVSHYHCIAVLRSAVSMVRTEGETFFFTTKKFKSLYDAAECGLHVGIITDGRGLEK